MKTKLFAVLVVAGVLLAVAAQIFAHHAEVVYDTSRTITLTGTVTKFLLTNPHGTIHFQVKDEQGQVEDWIAELGPPGIYLRNGWTRDTIKPGDHITMTSHPHKEGIHRVRFEKLEINGKVLRAGPAAN